MQTWQMYFLITVLGSSWKCVFIRCSVKEYVAPILRIEWK